MQINQGITHVLELAICLPSSMETEREHRNKSSSLIWNNFMKCKLNNIGKKRGGKIDVRQIKGAKKAIHGIKKHICERFNICY